MLPQRLHDTSFVKMAANLIFENKKPLYTSIVATDSADDLKKINQEAKSDAYNST